MERKMIDSEVLCKAIAELAANSSRIITILPELARMIRDLPDADAVPVVRCKDCRYFHGSALYAVCGFWDRPEDAGSPAWTSADGFCSHGEVRSHE